MAFVLPVISAIGAVSAAGGVVAAMSTVGGFLTVAGGVLAGVGAITGNKSLQKLGGIMSLGGGAANALGFGAKAADAASGAASVADSADEVVGSGLTNAGTGVDQVAGAGLAEGAETLGGSGMTASTKAFGDSLAAKLPELSSTASTAAEPLGGILSKANTLVANTPTDYGLASGTLDAGSKAGALSEVAKTFGQNDIASVLQKGWERTQDALSGIGKFAKDNKELVAIGAQGLQSMYSPQAEALDYQKRMIEEARKRLNTPIKLAMNPMGG